MFSEALHFMLIFARAQINIQIFDYPFGYLNIHRLATLKIMKLYTNIPVIIILGCCIL